MTDGRYRIYRVVGGEQQVVATTDTAEGVGLALVTLAEEGEWMDARVGVLDKPDESKPGRWLVNPYAHG